MDHSSKYGTFLKRYLAFLIDSFIFLPFPLLANYYGHSSNMDAFFILTILHLLFFTLYVVIGHGRYGQTVGKRLMGIKVLDTAEKGTIGYRKSFLRESIWFVAQLGGMVYVFTGTPGVIEPITVHETFFKSMVGPISTAWIILELVTMLFNQRRRALHDLIGGSVVVDLNELKREHLDKRIQEAIPTLQER